MSEPGLTLRRGSPIRRAIRRTTVLVAVASAVVALATGVGAPGGSARAAEAAPRQAGSPSAARAARPAATASKVTVSIAVENAGVVSPGQELAVSVTVANPTAQVLVGGTASVWVDPSSQKSRGALNSWLGSTDPVTGPVPLGDGSFPMVQPGASTVVHMTVPAASLPFQARTTPGVYGVGATVNAGAKSVSARSSVVWNPGGAPTRSSVAVVMPIVTPSRSDGVIPAADLSTYTGPNGVLTRDLDGLVGHSTVAVGIDPMIIASIRVLGNAAPASATEWLARLSTLPNDTFSLGYADADITGQLQAGLAAPEPPASLAFAMDPRNFTPTPSPIGEPPSPTAAPAAPTPSPTPTTGPALPSLESLLAWDYTLKGVAWPGDKTVRNADLAPLAASGYSTTIVSGSNTNADDLASTPNAAIVAGAGRVTASDQRLSDALRQAISASGDLAWTAAMDKLNAQLALTSAEGTTPRHLLLALDRSWPSSGTQLQRTLDAVLGSAWTTPATFRSVSASHQTSSLALDDASESPARLRDIQALMHDEKSLGEFSTILDNPLALTSSTRAQLLTLLAVSWQSPHADWAAAVTKSRAATDNTIRAVHILPTENVNLVSAQGSIPFTVSNALSGQGATVVLTAAPSNSRLEIDQTATKRIPADSRATMLIPVKAKVGNGQVTLTLRLYSPTGVPIGDPTFVTVDVHADWEGIGALIFGVLVVLLFGFGIVRNIRRRRTRATGAAGTAVPEPTPDAASEEPASAEPAAASPASAPERDATSETEAPRG